MVVPSGSFSSRGSRTAPTGFEIDDTFKGGRLTGIFGFTLIGGGN